MDKVEQIISDVMDFVFTLFKVIGDFFNSFKPSED